MQIGGHLRLSVIIPAYQAEKTIKDCIESVYANPGEIEVIVVDDGSRDRTGAICDELATAYDSLKVIHVSNGGVSRARNIGLENTKGDFITFVDADDRVAKNYFRQLLEAAVESGAELVVMKGRMPSGRVITGRDYIEGGILEADTHVWSKLYSRNLLYDGDNLRVRFPEDLTIGEDMMFLLDVLLGVADSRKVICIDGDGYSYSENEEGAMLRSFKESFLDEIYCWVRIGEVLEKRGFALSDERRVRLSTHQIMAAMLTVSKFAGSYESMKKEDAILAGAMKDRVCSLAATTIENAKKVPGTFSKLETGYKIKTIVFAISNGLYLRLYGQWKKR